MLRDIDKHNTRKNTSKSETVKSEIRYSKTKVLQK